MKAILSTIEGYKTVLGVLALVLYKWASTHGVLTADPTIETAIYGWIIYGIGSKIDKVG